MKIISRFIREQKKYTKNELRSIFSFNEEEIKEFIKNLNYNGILKTKSKDKNKDLTGLVDEDIQGFDEIVSNDNCNYVFTYVGIIIIGNRVIKVYPKYIQSDEKPLLQMKQIVKVLERYKYSKKQTINLLNGDGDNSNFNILGAILYLLNDYFENGVYNNTEKILEVNGEGEILWEKTIDDSFAFIEDNRPYYIELITHQNIENDMEYFKRLHEYILTECSKLLQDAGLEDLFEMETVMLSEEGLDDFGNKDYILDRIMAELNIQFNTHKQITLKTIYTYISQDKKMFEKNQGIGMFGTTAFYLVWEKACAEVFGNKLKTPIGKLNMKNSLVDGYNSKAKLIDLIEKPKWNIDDKTIETKETLEPDLISINEQDCFIIIDAKYYLLELEGEEKLRGNPGVGDITKQYLYHLAYKNFIQDHDISVVKNCFVMPTEEQDIIIKGSVKMEMLSILGLEDIKIRQIPAAELFSFYLSRKRMPIDRLVL